MRLQDRVFLDDKQGKYGMPVASGSDAARPRAPAHYWKAVCGGLRRRTRGPRNGGRS